MNAKTNIAATLPAGIPLGRRTPRGTRRWYLVHAPGREEATCQKLLRLIDRSLLEDAFVMRKEHIRKRHGAWVTSIVPLYRDYIVVVTRDAAALDAELSRLSFPVSIAQGEGGHYAPLAAEAQAWYEAMMDDTHTIRASTAVIVDGVLQIQDGPMRGQEDRVTKIMRRESMCTVAVAEGGHAFSECVPFVVPFRS